MEVRNSPELVEPVEQVDHVEIVTLGKFQEKNGQECPFYFPWSKKMLLALQDYSPRSFSPA